MPLIVRVPVDLANPGLLSIVGALNVIAVTAMAPGAPTIAGAPPAADDTATSITKAGLLALGAVAVPTLNVPAA